MSRGSGIVTVGLLVGIVMAGCSAEAPGPMPDPAAGPGPLTQFWRTLATADAETGAAELLIEERVAECMSELGFDYTPVDTSLGYELTNPTAELGTREYAEQYGYGIATDPMGFVAGGRQQLLDGGPGPDPNEAYVEAMSEAARAAYLVALWGPAVIEDEVGADEDAEFGGAVADEGCQGRARADVARMTAWRDTPGYELAVRGATAAAQDAQNDPRVAALDEAWSQCMAEAGYPGHSRPWEPSQAFAAQANAANERAYAGVDTEPTEDQLRAAWARADADLAEIASQEVATALADVDCQEAVAYAAVTETVTAEYEEEFYAEHREELEATLAAFLQAQEHRR